MKNVIGTPVRGDSFFPRNSEIEKILSHLENGNNLQIAAPRRIGKTSILFHLLDNRLENYVYVYVDTEAIDDENEFFKKLLKELLRVEEIRGSGRLKKLLEQGQKFLNKVKSIGVLDIGLEFREDNGPVNYKEDLMNFLLGMELDNAERLIILLDEFAQTIQNIIDKDKGDLSHARRFLQSNREIRLHPEIASKVNFIVTGSIGLNHTVAGISSTAFINDLASVEVGPLSTSEAREFLQKLLASRKITISQETEDYLFKRVEWLIPFHIQLTVQELISLVMPDVTKKITHETIDKAFDAIIQARNTNHFDHYYSRLKKQFKGPEFDYVSEVLEGIARAGTLPRTAIFDISVKYKLQDKWRHLIEVLVYDGYINNIGDAGAYRFNSPIVRMWWERFICK